MKKDSEKKGGMMGSILAVAILAALGLGSGYMLALTQSKPAEEVKEPAKKAEAAPPEAEAHGAAPAEKKAEGHGGGEAPAEASADEAEAVPLEDVEPPASELVVVPFPPITTNLREPPATWIRLEGSLLVRKETEAKPEKLAMEAAQQVMAYLRTLSIVELQGSTGLYNVSADLNDIVRGSSAGNVRKLMISGLVVE